MRKEEIESLLEKNEGLRQFLKEAPDETRKIKKRTIFNICCNEKMIEIERYKIIGGSRGKLIEVKSPARLYYCIKCNYWCEI